MNSYFQVPDPVFATSFADLVIPEEIAHLHCRHDDINRVCNVLRRNASRTHISVANSFDFFNFVPGNNSIKFIKYLIELIHYSRGINTFNKLRKSMNICEAVSYTHLRAHETVLD